MGRIGISKLAVALFLTSGAVALGPSGCTPSSASLCNKVCDCTGCSDDERADCVDDLDDARKDARDEGCGSEYDAYFSCTSSELTCEDDSVQVDGCDSELEDFTKCMGGAVPVIGKDPCRVAIDKLVAKFEECGIEVEAPPEDQECNPADAALLQCYVPCYEAATCAVVTGAEQSQELNDCVSSCL